MDMLRIELVVENVEADEDHRERRFIRNHRLVARRRFQGTPTSAVGLDDNTIGKTSERVQHHGIHSTELVVPFPILNDRDRAVAPKLRFDRREPIVFLTHDDERRHGRRRHRHLHMGRRRRDDAQAVAPELPRERVEHGGLTARAHEAHNVTFADR